MIRKEVEAKILKKMKEIWDLVLEYNPDSTFLTMDIQLNDEIDPDLQFFHANNIYWDADRKHPITFVSRERRPQ